MAEVVYLPWQNQPPAAVVEADQPLQVASGGGGGSSGMDAWQQTVETRLAELRSDVRTAVADLSATRADVAAIKSKVEALPSKTFVVQALVGGMAAFAAIVSFADQI